MRQDHNGEYCMAQPEEEAKSRSPVSSPPPGPEPPPSEYQPSPAYHCSVRATAWSMSSSLHGAPTERRKAEVTARNQTQLLSGTAVPCMSVIHATIRCRTSSPSRSQIQVRDSCSAMA